MLLIEAETVTQIERLTQTLLTQGANLGMAIIKALIVFLVGRLLIGLINKLVKRVLVKRNVDPSVRSFVSSFVSVVLIVLLVISIIGALGIQTTSFAALIASLGVSLGIAMSGNLSNFAGGIIILMFRPFKVGDFISNKEISGTVAEIQIFHTILNTSDNIRVYIPNGSLSSGIIKNMNVKTRRVEWTFGVDYGMDYERVEGVIKRVLEKDSRILSTPAGLVALSQLDSSSVNIVVRAWVNASDYWAVYFAINKDIYETFNAEGINFPYPQITVHRAEKN